MLLLWLGALWEKVKEVEECLSGCFLLCLVCFEDGCCAELGVLFRGELNRLVGAFLLLLFLFPPAVPFPPLAWCTGPFCAPPGEFFNTNSLRVVISFSMFAIDCWFTMPDSWAIVERMVLFMSMFWLWFWVEVGSVAVPLMKSVP